MSVTASGKTKAAWTKHAIRWRKCQLCALHKRANNHVLGRGKLPCDILFIGEAPGKSENLLGQPFVGRSGKLLDNLIAESREDNELSSFSCFITNTVACIPWKNPDGSSDAIRVPSPEEISECELRVKELTSIAQPVGIVLLGKTAEQAYLASDLSKDIPTTVLQHPAFVLRNGGLNSVEGKRWVLTLRQFVNSLPL